MKPKHNPYRFFDQFCLRTPLFPLKIYQDLTKGAEITDQQFCDIWEKPLFREALFLASPELYAEIEKWMQGKLTDTTILQGLRTSFLKYVARVSSRCTPFGLFAGCSIGTFDKETHIHIGKHTTHTRQTRFDMNFLVALSQMLSKQAAIKEQLRWYPNNSLYRIGTQYRYVEYQYDKNNNREHSLEAVEHSPYLEILLAKATDGATLAALASVLVDDEITLEEAQGFLDQLVFNQILVSELEPAVTGDDFLEQMIQTISALDATETIVGHLQSFKNALDQIDRVLGNAPQQYTAIGNQIEQLEIPFKQKYLFQTDLYPALSSRQLHQQWGYRLTRLMGVLSKMRMPTQETNMDRFISAFTKRYETREIPLTTALDTEIGIGYLQHQDASDSTPFLEDLHIPVKRSNTQQYQWTALEEILSKKLQELPADETILTLVDQDFKDVEEQLDTLPDTMSAMTELVRIGDDTKMVVSSIGGSSAANLLGRFTTGDPEMLAYVQKMTAIEQQMHPEAVLAEIVHLPQSRTGNVIRRASLRDYEIPYLGKSNLPVSKQIPIEDILISVKFGKVWLRSKKLNTYILPRLSNAHNYSANALPIYHFLCDLQTQKIRSGIGFYWGSTLERRPFLPRVCYKDFILRKACWTISVATIAPIVKDSNANVVKDLIEWRASLQVPQYVQLVDGDNTLLINLENQTAIEMLWNTVKNRNSFILEEFLFTEESVVTDTEANGYTNQMVISFYNSSKTSSELSGQNTDGVGNHKKSEVVKEN